MNEWKHITQHNATHIPCLLRSIERGNKKRKTENEKDSHRTVYTYMKIGEHSKRSCFCLNSHTQNQNAVGFYDIGSALMILRSCLVQS